MDMDTEREDARSSLPASMPRPGRNQKENKMKKKLFRLLAILVLASFVLSACAEEEKIMASGTLRADETNWVTYEVNQFDEIHITVPEGETALPCLQLFASSCMQYKHARVWVTTDITTAESVVYTQEYQP